MIQSLTRTKYFYLKNPKVQTKIIFVAAVLISVGCSSNLNIKTIKVGSYTLKGNFNDDSTADGRVEYYDSSGHFSKWLTFKNNLKDGPAVVYHPNGSISDSGIFKYDRQYGYWSHYASRGKYKWIDFYYWGLPLGPELFYQDKKLTRFQFNDFNREPLVICRYDTAEKLSLIERFSMKLVFGDNSGLKKELNRLFAYLPKIPNSEQEFSIGITNKNKDDKKLFAVISNNFFIDTLLPNPPTEWNYYILCSIKTNDGYINKNYMEILADTSMAN